MAKQLSPGVRVGERTLVSVEGERITVPDGGRLVHLQFRRFAGCPICNIHLRSIQRRYAEIEAHGIGEVVVFHSPAGELAPYVAELPFPVIADPEKELYREFGVESAPRALLDPRAWPGIVTGIARATGRALQRKEPVPSLRQQGGRLGLPADFLIASDGEIVAAKYGAHADDQWQVDELLATSLAPRSQL
ncbi:alkyl hydroperoxide reductase [Prauserella marina]|uniref:Peroxiredoxin n=1 Tax=Prauserella marina TaxID=530584 RepID=A0A222W0H9_9PSEU|nr:peroxiredoxin-like family protein [Prauserella marina]ASR39689.1 alkyl hydroperoxide reductase [Prauserella marina]PWV73255.1 peroxiredoxin [Prauserella marina]SDD68061.1 Peroxiredoxin [Prauserella marina]